MTSLAREPGGEEPSSSRDQHRKDSCTITRPPGPPQMLARPLCAHLLGRGCDGNLRDRVKGFRPGVPQPHKLRAPDLLLHRL